MHEYQKEFIKELENVTESRKSYEVMGDFLNLGMLSLVNSVYKEPEIEENYLRILQKYPKNAGDQFAKLMSLVVMGLQEYPKDFLGEVYMDVVGSNQKTGEYFTPYSVCEMLVSSIYDKDKVDSQIEERGYISIHDPSCGSGAMIVAFRKLLQSYGYGTENIFVDVCDLTLQCVNMTYIQFSLLGIPGYVRWGDTLTKTEWSAYYTVPYFLSAFQDRFHSKALAKTMRDDSRH